MTTPTEAPAESESGPRLAPRRAWVAMLLSFACPGLGHLYAGGPFRGIVVLGLVLTLGFGAVWVLLAVFLGSPWTLAMGALVCLPLVFAVPLDAILVARKRRRAPRSRWNRWPWYLAYMIVFLLVWNQSVIGGMLVKLNDTPLRPVHVAKVPSDSMMPTLRKGDYILVDTSRRRARASGPGALIVFTAEVVPPSRHIRRIVGLAGDSVAVRRGRLVVNGHEATTAEEAPPFSATEKLGRSHYRVLINPHETWGPYRVEDGAVFVLGDNRPSSQDSRHFGSVALGSVEGRPLGVLPSTDVENGAASCGRGAANVLERTRTASRPRLRSGRAPR